MNNIQVVAHTSFLGKTGYNAHSQAFFTHLNKLIPTRVRNYSYTDDLSFMTKEQMDMIIQQKWNDPPHQIGKPFIQDPSNLQVDIILNESHHYFFYDQYDSPMIAYNVWESTRQLPEFFNRVLEYDQFWCPTEWQRQCTIDQGYPADRVKVVPEGVNGNIFKPNNDKAEKEALFRKYNIPSDAFVFMIFGRWDYRKAVKEMIEAWVDTFKHYDDCYLVISVDNPFSTDGMETTEQRLKHYNLEHERIRVLHFPPRDEYIKWLQHGSCLLSVSRSEGWNLPLMEAIACGTPTICSDWGGHLEFADGVSYKVQVPKELPPKNVFLLGGKHDLGVWGEPDFDHMKYIMRNHVYKNPDAKPQAMVMSKYIRELYTWDNAARKAKEIIEELVSYRKHYLLVKNIHGMELYQDQYINGVTVVEGKRDCKSRYEAMKPVFEKYNRPFTILDIGANFGYYSIRASTDYGATSIMIESNENEVKTLKSLCEHNNCRDNLTILNTRLNLYKLKELVKCEHFDVVFALNVLHHFNNEDVKDACETLIKLGDNIILETPPSDDSGACGQNNLQTIIDYFRYIEKIKLGEFKRHTSNKYSEMFWIKSSRTDLRWPYYEYEKLFTNKEYDAKALKSRKPNFIESTFNYKTIYSPKKDSIQEWIPGINLKTFIELNGIYPDNYNIINKLKNRDIITDYKWDGTDNDLTVHNFILNGCLLYLIDFDDKTIKRKNTGDENQLQEIINYIHKYFSPVIQNPKFNVHFVDGPFAEVVGNSEDKGIYKAEFIDLSIYSIVHKEEMKINTWTRPHRKWFTNWLIRIERGRKLVYQHKFNCEGKNILISFDSKSLGDSIAWMAKVEEFRKKHNCTVYLSTFWNSLFEEAYPEINFINPGSVVDNIYASYTIGCWEGNLFKNKIDWREVPLQHICSDILGLDHNEIITNIGIKPGPRPIKEKYVAITEFSTFQCKFWNYPGGWQEIVNYLNDIGYRVMSISKEETKLKNVIKMNNRSIEETITNIAHCDFFIGVSSGPSWISWALQKPVILISGFSSTYAEFETKCEKVINKECCNSCFNDTLLDFNRGDWMWCPRMGGTERAFECTKKIIPEMVIERINRIVKGIEK